MAVINYSYFAAVLVAYHKWEVLQLGEIGATL